jgi:hypothetical protein
MLSGLSLGAFSGKRRFADLSEKESHIPGRAGGDLVLAAGILIGGA